MQQPWRSFVIIFTIIGLIALVWKTCMSLPRKIDFPLPPDSTKVISVADTATNCYKEPLDVHGNIYVSWFLCGGEEGKRSEVKCFHIDTIGYSDQNFTFANWRIHTDGTMDIGGPAHWNKCSYLIDSAKTSFRMFHFSASPAQKDTTSFEILRLDNDYMILYRINAMNTPWSDIYMRRR
ncbi:MAG TPA: hypothetical protein VL651_05485 [Bacteroidia bacterium]|jgi:hypothetical protein|nr:hypothetical protein [Bacteroidia bacterium]